MAEIEISFDLGKLKKFIIIGFLLVLLALELIITFTNPIAFGDEGFHVSVARYVGTQADYSKYTPLFGSDLNLERFARPPFWNLIESSFYFMFGFDDAFVKFLVPFMSFLTGLTIYALGRRIYSENAGIIGAAIAVTIPSFVTYSVLFYTVVPYVFFVTVAFMSLLTAIKTGSRKFWVLAGIFSGVSILANIAGLFMVALTVLMGFVHLARNRNMRGFVEALKTYGIVVGIAALLMLPMLARNYGLFWTEGCTNVRDIFQGTCPEKDVYQQVTANQFAGRTAGGGTEGSILDISPIGYLQFAYGFGSPNNILNIIGIAFVPFSFLAGMVVLAKRREMPDIALLISVFIFLGLFFQLGGFTGDRSEDLARYFLSAIPLIGLAGAAYWSQIKKDGHKLNWLIVLVVLVVVLILSFLNFDNKVVQMDSVKDFIPSFFLACNWIDENLPQDADLLSLHTYPTRYNCDRAAVWEIPDKGDILLSNNLTLVRNRLAANGIDYIFVQKFALSSTPLGQAYPVSFVDFLERNNQTFVRVYENGPLYGTQEFVSCINSGGCDPGNIVYKVEFSTLRPVGKIDLGELLEQAGEDQSQLSS